METGYSFEKNIFPIEIRLSGFANFHELWNIITVNLIYLSLDSVHLCHLSISKFKGLISNLQLMWDKSELKAEQLTYKLVFLKIFN